MIRIRAVMSVAWLLCMGSACAQNARAIWIDVPFVHQAPEGCGAASLSMLLEYWAKRQPRAAPVEDVASIQRQLYSNRQHGISAESMQRYLRERGFQAFGINGNWTDLEEQLGKGRPLIVALRPRGQSELHYVVIDGIDPDRALVTMNDPAERKLLTEERAGFEKDWSATHNWMLVAVPGSR